MLGLEVLDVLDGTGEHGSLAGLGDGSAVAAIRVVVLLRGGAGARTGLREGADGAAETLELVVEALAVLLLNLVVGLAGLAGTGRGRGRGRVDLLLARERTLRPVPEHALGGRGDRVHDGRGGGRALQRRSARG